MTMAAIALCGLVACGSNEPKSFDGLIADATMNTVTVKALTSDSTQTFSLEGADMTLANGLLLGAPVIVDYKGKLEQITPALKVSTDPTYAEAIGKWTMPDPLNPDSLSMGVEIQIQGAAQSINMATMRYTSWELQGETEKVLLKGISEGSGEPAPFTQVATLSKNAEGKWAMAIEGTEIIYTKSEL